MFELSQDHEDFRSGRARLRHRRGRAHVAQWDRTTTSRPTSCRRWVSSASSASSSRRSTAARLEPKPTEGAFTSLCIAIEELGRVDQSIGITLSAGVGLGINPILTYGTDEQKERYLPDLVAGRALAGFGLTEPDAGSDAGATRTKPVPSTAGSGWSTAPRPSSPTPAPTSPRSSR
jgi:short/branched chain acyl-CoA dehydrogenase